MMKIIMTMIIILLISGCSTTRVITPRQGLEINKQATFIMQNNKRFTAKTIKTKEDSVFVVHYSNLEQYSMHFSQVQKVVVERKGKGALHGSLIGGVGAAGLAFLAIPADDEWKRSRSSGAKYRNGGRYPQYLFRS